MSGKLLNAAGMKANNQKKILNKLRVCKVSRAEMSRQTGLTRSGIGVLVDQMMKEGLLIEGDPITGKVGRASVEIQLNPDKYCIAGINIARDFCYIGIGDFCSNIKQVAQIDLINSQNTIHEILERITQTLQAILKHNPCKGELIGIGITCPGPLDVKNGKILNPPNFPRWENLDIVTYFMEKFNCPIFLENNANALALAEQYFGIGGTVKNYIEFVVDTGIGGGIVLDGNLYKGKSGFGSDFGHTTVDINGSRCGCGNIGCVELYASITNIMKFAYSIHPKFTSWKKVIDLAEQDDPDAEAILNREIKYLSAAITTALNIIDVETIVMAGDITYKGELINRRIKEQVNQQLIGQKVKQANIISSQLHSQANILSCMNLVLENFIQNMEL